MRDLYLLTLILMYLMKILKMKELDYKLAEQIPYSLMKLYVLTWKAINRTAVGIKNKHAFVLYPTPCLLEFSTKQRGNGQASDCMCLCFHLTCK